MTISNDASLRGKAKALAKEHGLSAQEVMQRYFFEHFLMRLERTRYRERFVIKGGLLLSSMMGMAQRTTMDLDATVRALPLDGETISVAMQEICSINLEDGIAFAFERAEPIREDDDYGGLRAHLTAEFGRMRTPLKVDVTTGDAITPREIEYEFPTLFGEGPIHLMSYPLETCIAEKFEAVVKRGAATTRARDLYDLAMLVRLYERTIDWEILREAVRRTSEHRGSSDMMRRFELVSREIEGSDEIARIWSAYTRLNPYASEISVADAMDAVRMIGERIDL
jgi:predicted nucleotidyltransferase component of viral defense system